MLSAREVVDDSGDVVNEGSTLSSIGVVRITQANHAELSDNTESRGSTNVKLVVVDVEDNFRSTGR